MPSDDIKTSENRAANERRQDGGLFFYSENAL